MKLFCRSPWIEWAEGNRVVMRTFIVPSPWWHIRIFVRDPIKILHHLGSIHARPTKKLTKLCKANLPHIFNQKSRVAHNPTCADRKVSLHHDVRATRTIDQTNALVYTSCPITLSNPARPTLNHSLTSSVSFPATRTHSPSPSLKGL